VLKLSLADLTDTRRFAVVFAAMLRNGDVVLLDGEMGAGKTTTTKLIAEAIGVVDDVTSPTYTLVHTYSGGRLTLHHADLYRLKSTAEIDDLGLEEMLSAGGVLLIEWGAPAGELFPTHVFVSLSRSGPHVLSNLKQICRIWWCDAVTVYLYLNRCSVSCTRRG
jgi:tRNA threonylcarbamoyladenosine biosynthesis protein TsaE